MCRALCSGPPTVERARRMVYPRRRSTHVELLRGTTRGALAPGETLHGTPGGSPRHAAHFSTIFHQPHHGRGDYRTVGHGVTQFGMFAAAPLFGPDAR